MGANQLHRFERPRERADNLGNDGTREGVRLAELESERGEWGVGDG